MTTEKTEVKDINEELAAAKTELERVKNERDKYKAAYEHLAEQNANIWGMYSNLIDYVADQTIRKQAK